MSVPSDGISPDDPVGGGGAPGTGDGGGTGGGTGGGGSGAGGPTVGVGTPIFSLTFTKDEASSVVRVLAYASVSSGDDLIFNAYLTIDGVIRQAGGVYAKLVKAKAIMPVTLPTYISGLAAGDHSIVFSIRNLEPDSALTVLTGSTIEITELKKGAV